MGRRDIIKEIISTEKSYVDDLLTIKQLYMEPLRDNKLLDQRSYRRIFENLSTIMSVNTGLLEQLKEYEDADANSRKPKKTLGEIFVDFAPFLKSYTIYCSNYMELSATIREKSDKNKKFQKFLQEAKDAPEAKGLSWSSLFITPVQRIPRYKLLLQDLLKHTSQYHADRDNLNKALEEINEVAVYLDEKLEEIKLRYKIIELVQKTSGISENDLVKSSRWFIDQGELNKISKRPQRRVIWLFNDIVVYCSRSGSESYKYKNTIDLTSSPRPWVWDLPSPPDENMGKRKREDVAFPFLLITAERTLFLSASSQEEKDEWISLLRDVISKIFEKKTEEKNEGTAEIHLSDDNLYFKLYHNTSVLTVPTLHPRSTSPPVIRPRRLHDMYTQQTLRDASCLGIVQYKFHHRYQDEVDASPGDVVAILDQPDINDPRFVLIRHTGVRIDVEHFRLGNNVVSTVEHYHQQLMNNNNNNNSNNNNNNSSPSSPSSSLPPRPPGSSRRTTRRSIFAAKRKSPSLSSSSSSPSTPSSSAESTSVSSSSPSSPSSSSSLSPESSNNDRRRKSTAVDKEGFFALSQGAEGAGIFPRAFLTVVTRGDHPIFFERAIKAEHLRINPRNFVIPQSKSNNNASSSSSENYHSSSIKSKNNNNINNNNNNNVNNKNNNEKNNQNENENGAQELEQTRKSILAGNAPRKKTVLQVEEEDEEEEDNFAEEKQTQMKRRKSVFQRIFGK